MLVDTHAHLNFPDFQKDLDRVIKRSIKNGVEKIICVSSNLADSEKAVEISQKYPGIIYAAVGIHPQQTDPENKLSLEKQIQVLKKLANQKEVVALGECGLDWSPAPRGEKNRSKKEQFYLFKEQLKIAQEKKLPLLIHTREAFNETLEILKETISKDFKNPQGVFHCYSAGKRGIEKVNQLGFYFGVDGNLTYDQGLQNIFKAIPSEKILLETDAPFLSPLPFRGQRNEPRNILKIAQFLSQLKGESFSRVSQKTTKNTKKIFQF